MEHLIFTGSKNFNEQHHLEKIINQYQGQNNGVTNAFSTSFFYQLGDDGLSEFLPALADAIANPSFDETNISKEINNVNSEISMRMTFNKDLGYYKFIKEIGNKKSKLFQDGFSNINTDQVNITDLKTKLHAFHEKYYSANIMRLVLISDLDPKDLQQKIETSFNVLKNTKIERPFYNDTKSVELPFSPEVLGSIYYLQGFTEPSKLNIFFPVPRLATESKTNMMNFVFEFLRYYSENSFTQTMIKKHLITGFSSSVVLEDYNNSVYLFSFSLTNHGLKNTSKILLHFFHFLNQIQNQKNAERIFNHLKSLSRYSFFFGTDFEFNDFATSNGNFFEQSRLFSETLLDSPPEDVFIKNIWYRKFNQTEFDLLLGNLKPENAIYMIESTKFKSNENDQPKKTTMPITKPAKRQNLTKQQRILIIKSIKNRNRFTDTSIINSIKLIKPSPMFALLNKRRILAEYSYDSSTDELNEAFDYNDIFDNSYETVILDHEFDFDNGRKYSSTKMKAIDFVKIEKQSKQVVGQFDTCKEIDTKFLNKFQMITKCQTPKSLKNSSKINFQSLTEVLNFVQSSNSQTTEEEGISTERVFSAVFNEDSNLIFDDRVTIIRDLNIYKWCLVNDFEDDSKIDNIDLILKSPGLYIYHQLYRKMLQPKAIVTITIESQIIIKSIMTTEMKNKSKKGAIIEILCMYIVRHVEFEHRNEYSKGGMFSCSVDEYRLVLKIEALTSQLHNFASKILNTIQTLTCAESFKNFQVKNYKQLFVNFYSNFNSVSSMKAAMFYLNLSIEKIIIDNSDDTKTQEIKHMINEIESEDLALTMEQFLTENKLTILGVGNLNQNLLLEISNTAKQILTASNSNRKNEFEFVDFRKFMTENFVLKMQPDEHLMLRLENIDKFETNSVYLTYFRFKRMDRYTIFHSLIMNEFLTKTVYEQLRNKFNLGYVAQSGFKVHYQVS